DSEERGRALRALRAGRVPDGRVEGSAHDPRLRSCLGHARRGDPQVVVVVDRLLDQCPERLVSEYLPPGQIGQGGGFRWRHLAAERLRWREGRTRVVGADRAGGEECAQSEDDHGPWAAELLHSGAPWATTPPGRLAAPTGSCFRPGASGAA